MCKCGVRRKLLRKDNYEESMVINQDIDTVYEIWREFEKFPKFMKNVTSVVRKNNNLIQWVAEGPFDIKIERGTKIVEQEENSKISWSSAG